MSNEKVCGSCVNAKFRSDFCMCSEGEDMYLVCQYTDKVVGCNNTCGKHECFPDGQFTWFQIIDSFR